MIKNVLQTGGMENENTQPNQPNQPNGNTKNDPTIIENGTDNHKSSDGKQASGADGSNSVWQGKENSSVAESVIKTLDANTKAGKSHSPRREKSGNNEVSDDENGGDCRGDRDKKIRNKDGSISKKRGRKPKDKTKTRKENKSSLVTRGSQDPQPVEAGVLPPESTPAPQPIDEGGEEFGLVAGKAFLNACEKKGGTEWKPDKNEEKLLCGSLGRFFSSRRIWPIAGILLAGIAYVAPRLKPKQKKKTEPQTQVQTKTKEQPKTAQVEKPKEESDPQPKVMGVGY